MVIYGTEIVLCFNIPTQEVDAFVHRCTRPCKAQSVGQLIGCCLWDKSMCTGSDIDSLFQQCHCLYERNLFILHPLTTHSNNISL